MQIERSSFEVLSNQPLRIPYAFLKARNDPPRWADLLQHHPLMVNQKHRRDCRSGLRRLLSNITYRSHLEVLIIFIWPIITKKCLLWSSWIIDSISGFLSQVDPDMMMLLCACLYSGSPSNGATKRLRSGRRHSHKYIKNIQIRKETLRLDNWRPRSRWIVTKNTWTIREWCGYRSGSWRFWRCYCVWSSDSNLSLKGSWS